MAEDPPSLRSEPLVSVVVPTRNRVALLQEALASILTQDYGRIECIVMDGGSDDGTVELLKNYGSRIWWSSAADGGPFNAINTGWQSSSGQILAWLNDDDHWLPETVTTAVAYLNEHPEVDVVYGQCRWIDEDGRPKWVSPAVPWDLASAVLYCDYFIHQPTAFVRRDVVERVGWLHPHWFHDQDLWVRIALANGTFGTLDVVQAEARIHRGKGGQNPRFVEAAKVALVQRWFGTLSLPPELASRQARAVSNAHARALDYLWPTRPSNWALGIGILGRAIAADPGNTPFILGHAAKLLGRFLSRFVRRN